MMTLLLTLPLSKIFSKLDLWRTYHQLELEETCWYIIMFITHARLYCYKRLLFGVSTASNIFHKMILGLLKDISEVENLSDIIVHGKTKRLTA